MYKRQLIESLDKAVKAGSDWQAEYRLVNFDDGPRTVRCFAHPMVDGGGQVIEFVGTVMDITEAKRVEDAIQRSEALLAEGQRLRDVYKRQSQRLNFPRPLSVM